eukprot:14900786-Alexandrium_andersonii.AAC.1
MFQCVQCGVKSNAELVCGACQNPLPALDEMTEFLEMWNHAIRDYRRNLRAGHSRASLTAMSSVCALRRQTERGVGPGVYRPAKEETAMDDSVPSEPPEKRLKTPGVSNRQMVAYLTKLSNDEGFRRCEGLLGKFVGQSTA